MPIGLITRRCFVLFLVIVLFGIHRVRGGLTRQFKGGGGSLDRVYANSTRPPYYHARLRYVSGEGRARTHTYARTYVNVTLSVTQNSQDHGADPQIRCRGGWTRIIKRHQDVTCTYIQCTKHMSVVSIAHSYISRRMPLGRLTRAR